MAVENGPVAARVASGSEKSCLYRARVLPVAAILDTPEARFGHHPIADAYVGSVPAYAMVR